MLSESLSYISDVKLKAKALRHFKVRPVFLCIYKFMQLVPNSLDLCEYRVKSVWN